MAEINRNVADEQKRPEHPSPDQLRSFAAEGLLQHERAAVREHLSGCAECRAFLAIVSPEEGPPPQSRATKKAA